jgi:hypothetical protein
MSISFEFINDSEQHSLFILIALSAITFMVLKLGNLCEGKQLIMVYSIVGMYPMCGAVYYSTRSLMDGSMMLLSSNAVDRLHAPHEGFMSLAQLTFAYEIWNTICAILIPEYRTIAFVGHHLSTGLLAKLAQQPYAAFYGLFFFGIASISTSLLCVVDMFRFGPPELNEKMPMINNAFRVLFALSFLLLRSFIWPIISAMFWYDVLGVIVRGGDGKQNVYVAAIFLISNIGLTFLQILWTNKIVSGLLKLIFPKKDNKSGKKK